MSTKIFLRRLTDMSTFNLLQDKLSRLNDTYLVSTRTTVLRTQFEDSTGLYSKSIDRLDECSLSEPCDIHLVEFV